jgi:hypothetical protein
VKLFEFQMRDGRRLYGQLSYVDQATETIYMLPQDAPGMLGTHGIPVPFSECSAIYCETVRPGQFDSEEQITMYRRRWRTG